eukprot:357433-Chlamydomonas_euryale.AAC.13
MESVEGSVEGRKVEVWEAKRMEEYGRGNLHPNHLPLAPCCPGKFEDVRAGLVAARADIMAILPAISQESYVRAYPSVARLHMLQEVHDALTLMQERQVWACAATARAATADAATARAATARAATAHAATARAATARSARSVASSCYPAQPALQQSVMCAKGHVKICAHYASDLCPLRGRSVPTARAICAHCASDLCPLRGRSVPTARAICAHCASEHRLPPLLASLAQGSGTSAGASGTQQLNQRFRWRERLAATQVWTKGCG